MRRIVAWGMALLLLLAAGVALAEFVFVESSPKVVETPPAAEVPNAGAPQDEWFETGPVEILITAAGDTTLGGNMKGNPSSNIYTKALAARDGDLSYFFANVRDIFEQDDLTIVNFEGVLTNTTEYGPGKAKNEFLFRAPPEHVEVLAGASVEAVALENNHVMDFGQQGYDDTVAALESRGIVYASDGRMGIYEVKGVRIAMLAYQTFNNAYDRLFTQVPQDIAAAKESSDIVIVSYHWGVEKDYVPTSNQIKLGRLTIDSGADLVLGHHSHRINPIEQYQGKYIVYSLSNASFSGNSKPSDCDTFLFQTKFIVDQGVATPNGFRVIPCSISSITAAKGAQSGENDFAVTPFEPGSDAAKRVINKMLQEGKKLQYAVGEYPTEW